MNLVFDIDCSNYEDVQMQFDKNIAPNVLVGSDGLCQWFPPGRFSTPCPIDISLFPFDDQVCEMLFQSWQYDGFKLNLTSLWDKVDTKIMNGEWSLLGKHTRAHMVGFPSSLFNRFPQNTNADSPLRAKLHLRHKRTNE